MALLDTLMHDPNVNVRLATIDALERFASEESVRRAAVDAMDRQTSPFVQIALIDFMVKVKDRESVATLRRLSQDPAVNDAVRVARGVRAAATRVRLTIMTRQFLRVGLALAFCGTLATTSVAQQPNPIPIRIRIRIKIAYPSTATA